MYSSMSTSFIFTGLLRAAAGVWCRQHKYTLNKNQVQKVTNQHSMKYTIPAAVLLVDPYLPVTIPPPTWAYVRVVQRLHVAPTREVDQMVSSNTDWAQHPLLLLAVHVAVLTAGCACRTFLTAELACRPNFTAEAA